MDMNRKKALTQAFCRSTRKNQASKDQARDRTLFDEMSRTMVADMGRGDPDYYNSYDPDKTPFRIRQTERKRR